MRFGDGGGLLQSWFASLLCCDLLMSHNRHVALKSQESKMTKKKKVPALYKWNEVVTTRE